MLRPLFVVLLLALSLTSCGNDERTRNEAMLFLDRFEEIDIDDPIEERRVAIERIRSTALSDEDVIRARDACVDAHTAMIEAEDESAAARHQFVVASHGGAEVPPDIAHQIDEAIQASGAAIEHAQELFPRCQREANALQTRFHWRRSHTE